MGAERLFLKWEHGDFQQERGRFRSYVLGALKRFLAGESRKRATWKRGGRHTLVSIDREAGESWVESLADGDAAPDVLFDIEKVKSSDGFLESECFSVEPRDVVGDRGGNLRRPQ